MSLNRQNDVDSGRALLVLVIVYFQITCIASVLYMNGVVLVVLLDQYQEDLAKTSMIGALNNSILCLLGPIVSVFMNIYSCRICVVFGGFVLSMSYFVSFFVQNINIYIITIGVIGGIGNSFALVPLPPLLSYHFEKWRNITVGFLMVFAGVGMLIASPLSLWLIDCFGLSGSFLIISGFTLHLCAGGLLCKPNSKEKALWRTRRNIELKSDTKKRDTILNHFKSEGLMFLKLIKNIRLILFLLSTVSWNVVLSGCSTHLPRYMVMKGFNNDDVITVMTIFSFSHTAGRFLAATTTGTMGLDSFLVHFGSSGILTLSLIMFQLYSGYHYAGYIFASISGFYTGSPNSLVVPILVKLIDIEFLSGGIGLYYFSAGVGYLIGPPYIGLVYGATGSYNPCFMSLGFVSLVGTICSLVAFRGQVTTDEKQLNIKLNTIVPSENNEAATTPDSIDITITDTRNRDKF